MTHPTDDGLDALVKLTEEFVTATWHLLDNSETSGPKDDPTIAVWQPNFDEVSALLDRCEGLPSGSMEHMAAGELLAANMTAAIAALRAQLAEARTELVRRVDMHECAMAERDDATRYSDEQKARADLAEAALAAQIEAAIREMWCLCEDLEDEAYAKLKLKLTEHEQGFWAAQKMTAKRIRRATQMPTNDRTALDRMLAAAPAAVAPSLRITGPNSDGEYWLHINAGGRSGGVNLGGEHGPICKRLLDAASETGAKE